MQHIYLCLLGWLVLSSSPAQAYSPCNDKVDNVNSCQIEDRSRPDNRDVPPNSDDVGTLAPAAPNTVSVPNVVTFKNIFPVTWTPVADANFYVIERRHIRLAPIPTNSATRESKTPQSSSADENWVEVAEISRRNRYRTSLNYNGAPFMKGDELMFRVKACRIVAGLRICGDFAESNRVRLPHDGPDNCDRPPNCDREKPPISPGETGSIGVDLDPGFYGVNFQDTGMATFFQIDQMIDGGGWQHAADLEGSFCTDDPNNCGGGDVNPTLQGNIGVIDVPGIGGSRNTLRLELENLGYKQVMFRVKACHTTHRCSAYMFSEQVELPDSD